MIHHVRLCWSTWVDKDCKREQSCNFGKFETKLDDCSTYGNVELVYATTHFCSIFHTDHEIYLKKCNFCSCFYHLDRTEILKGVMKKSRDSFGKTQSVARGPGFANKEEEDLDSRHPLTRFSGSTGGQITSSSRSKQTNTGAQSSEEPRLIFPPIVQICDKKTEMRSMKVGLESEKKTNLSTLLLQCRVSN